MNKSLNCGFEEWQNNQIELVQNRVSAKKLN